MREIRIPNSTRKILVDDEDYERISIYTWTLRGESKGSVSRIAPPYIALASYIMGTDKRYDHKDRDPLNNQKHNLREATQSQNMSNRPKQESWRKDYTSKYKGVSYDNIKLTKKWRAVIYHNHRKIELGYYLTEEEAARRYDKAALFYHKEFACLNFPAI